MTHRDRVGRPAWICAFALAFVVSAAIGACYNGDQSCSEAYNPNDPDDHCPYGPPGGPKLTGDNAPKCPEVPKLDPMSAECQITFAEVYLRLDAADGGNCSAGGNGCHANPIKGIAPLDGEVAMLAALEVYKGDIGRKYFDREAPEKSWWVCNLRGDAGKLMPTGGTPRMKAADIALVERWLGCGAPLGAATKIVGGAGGAGGDGQGGEGGAAGGP